MSGKVLIIGASGFIGCHLVPQLLASGVRVRVLVHNASIPWPDVEVAKGDVLDLGSLREALCGIEAVVNLAGQNRNIQECIAVNSAGMHNLALAAQQCKLARLVHLSSTRVYGECRKAREADRPTPDTIYGVMKYAAELILRQSIEGPRLTILRSANLFGPGQQTGLLAYLLRSSQSDRSLYFDNDGSMVRDFIHVRDLVAVIQESLDRAEICGVFNVGTGSQYRLTEVIALFEQTIGISFSKTFDTQSPTGNIGEICCDKFRRSFATRPKYTIETYLKELRPIPEKSSSG